MILYTGLSQEDLLIAQWYARMRSDGELESTFSKVLSPLGVFMSFFRLPGHLLIYETDNLGIMCAWWFEEALDGVCGGLYLRPDYRKKREGLDAVLRGLEVGLMRWPVIVGITREALLRPHKRLGYTVVGAIPKLRDGEAQWIVCITQEAFDERQRRKRKAKRDTDEHTRPTAPSVHEAASGAGAAGR